MSLAKTCKKAIQLYDVLKGIKAIRLVIGYEDTKDGLFHASVGDQTAEGADEHQAVEALCERMATQLRQERTSYESKLHRITEVIS